MRISKGAALFCEMGTGKTLMSIYAAEILHYYGKIDKVLVICPLSLIDVWCSELQLHANNSSWWRIIGNKTKRNKQLSQFNPLKLNWYIINIDAIAIMEQEFKKTKFDLVIIDESTVIKNRKAKRTKKVIELFGLADYKLILSGNPIPQSPGEIYAQYAFADCGIFGNRYYYFREEYFNVDYFNNIISIKDPEKFNRKMFSIAYRKRKEECFDLPPKIYEVEKIEMAPEQKKVYNDMKKDAIASYHDTTCAASVVLAKMIRLSQICGGFLPSSNGGSPIAFQKNTKLERLIELVSLQKEQIVIWARFQLEIRTIEDTLKKAGYDCVTFYGDTKIQDRNLAREQFRTGKVQVFVGNPAAGGRGINDLVNATTVIYYSNDYSVEKRIQSEDRTHRLGTRAKVVYLDLLMKNSIDEMVYYHALMENKSFSEMLLNRKLEIDFL